MLPKDMTEFDAYPEVKRFVETRVTPHFADARGLLQQSGFNFIVAHGLCNIVSGLSTTLFKPTWALKKLNRNGKAYWVYRDGADEKKLGANRLFRELLENYYPWESGEIGSNKARDIYELVRCPFAHALGEDKIPGLDIRITKGKNALLEEVWSDIELTQIEVAASRPYELPVAWQGASPKFMLRVESFYRGLYELLRNLAADKTQMGDAEKRFCNGIIVWHE